MKWPIVIHKDPDSDYGVTVPDLPGCFSAGLSVEEALTEAAEAIKLHLHGMEEDGEPIPNPGTIEDHYEKDKFSGEWFCVLVC